MPMAGLLHVVSLWWALPRITIGKYLDQRDLPPVETLGPLVEPSGRYRVSTGLGI